ncbi:peptidase M20 [Leminorella grimontii]|uniref:Peptidase M20 n=1 Tax=Leminorella grimontii TaxID=82981 RepID=A0AAV5N5L1_9GAMM|nr:M20 family metallopeptidase [Leminorella grimontii]KFC97117.1 acetylornithine deacetylase/succinyl-diaminopimelate desuccinylase [Leminorella grimontii ATCC 33999 = DSM 5078]GKX57039.1 peptidase M20 [Leminorella grimontii]VFS57251.1 Carboxypeptidase G2 precursor [Leminorella grimontii]
MQLENYLDELRPLVNVDCGTQTVEGVAVIADIMAKKYKDMGWHAEIVDLGKEVGPGVFATNKPNASQYDVLLVGHMDTVFPPGTAAERPMSTDATRLYGPGAADMKSGLMNILWALRALDDKDVERLSIAVTMNPDEETGSVYSHEWIGKYAKQSRCVLVAEAARADGSLVKARKGMVRYNIDFHGRAAHAGNAPEKGRSAITELANWVLAINQLGDKELGTTLNVGVIKGGDAANIVPDKAQAVVDVRFWDNNEYDRINKAMHEMTNRAYVEDVTATVTQMAHTPAMSPSEETEKLMALVEKCGNEENIAINWLAVGGGSDANHTAALGVPSLDGFGPIGADFHSPAEYVELDSIIPRIKLLSRIVKSL